jgi:tetratricopeptide (TPR) repeat protein
MDAGRRLVLAAGILLVLCPQLTRAQSKTHKSRSGHSAAAAKTPGTPAGPSASAIKALEKLTARLKEKNSTEAYAALSSLALQKSSTGLNTRAALALGYYDYSRGRYPEAAKWLERAKKDPLLADYALFWDAETALAQQRNDAALAELLQVRQEYPDTAITEQVLQSIGVAAIALNQP